MRGHVFAESLSVLPAAPHYHKTSIVSVSGKLMLLDFRLDDTRKLIICSFCDV